MTKVKCCNNCAYCHMTKSNPMFCVTKAVVVDCDNICKNHKPIDVFDKFEEDRNENEFE